MPIRNMGTLLENVVLVEALRVLFEQVPAGAIELANSFAMPPLSSWRQHGADACFNATQMKTLQARQQPQSDSYAGLMWDCLQQTSDQPGTLGPSGMLLCAMLAARVGRPLRMWLNDIAAGRYGNALPELAAFNGTVQQVLGLPNPPQNRVVTCGTPYAASLVPPALDNLEATLSAWPADAGARLGYLDPMRYRISNPDVGETSSVDHQRWLRFLAEGFAGPVVSVHFTGHRNWEQLRPEVDQIRADGVAQGYHHAVTASHAYYHVVTVIRDPGGADASLATAHALNAAISSQWHAWCHAIQHEPSCVLKIAVE